MEYMQFTQSIKLVMEPSVFWDTASSIATTMSVVIVVLASIYRFNTMTPIEKLYLKGMDKVWMNLAIGMTQVFGIIFALLLSNFVIPLIIKFLIIGKPYSLPSVVVLFCIIFLIIAIVWMDIWLLIGGRITSYLTRFIQKYQITAVDRVVGKIYYIYMVIIFPLCGYYLFQDEKEISGISKVFQEKWVYILFILLFEWLFLISLEIKGFILPIKSLSESAHGNLLDPLNGEELYVCFMEDDILICTSKKDDRDNKYQFISITKVYDGKYLLTFNGSEDIKKLNNPGAFIIDVGKFKKDAPCWSLPIPELGDENNVDWQNDLIKSLKDKEILVYCKFPNRAVIAYCRLLKEGYPKVKRCLLNQKEVEELNSKYKL